MASHKAAKLLEGWSVQQAFKLLRLTRGTKSAMLYRAGGDDLLEMFEVPVELIYKDLPAISKQEILEKVRAYVTKRKSK